MLTLSISFTFFVVCTPLYVHTNFMLIQDFNNYSVMPHIRKLPKVNNGTYQDRRLLTDLDTDQMVTYLYGRVPVYFLMRHND